MLDIYLAKQHKHYPYLTIYSGSEITPIANGIAKKVIAFNQFHEYCTRGYWIADNVTEEQFEEMYNSGQRVFNFRNQFDNIVLVINEQTASASEVDEQFKKDKSDLFEDVVIQAQNYLDKILTKGEFRRFISLTNEFLIDKNKNRYMTEFLKIEDEAYERLTTETSQTTID